MTAIRRKKAYAERPSAPGASGFAFVEKLALAEYAPTLANEGRTWAPDRNLRGMLKEAAELASSGEAGRIAPEQLLAQWSGAFTVDELTAIVIPERTLARRKASGEPLTIEETERALRLARIATEAERVFDDPAKAARWLRKPNRALNLRKPISLLETETGARAVEELLGQIDHGVYV